MSESGGAERDSKPGVDVRSLRTGCAAGLVVVAMLVVPGVASATAPVATLGLGVSLTALARASGGYSSNMVYNASRLKDAK